MNLTKAGLGVMGVIWGVAGCGGQESGGASQPSGSGDKATTSVPVVFDARSEPPGAHCAAGGVALLSGPDNNRNGVLDSGEVTSTKYVCNGTSGTNGNQRQELAHRDHQHPGGSGLPDGR